MHWRNLSSPRFTEYRSYSTYKTFHETCTSETCANIIICLIRQTNYLLDQQLKALEADFLEEGGFAERLYHSRRKSRGG